MGNEVRNLKDALELLCASPSNAADRERCAQELCELFAGQQAALSEESVVELGLARARQIEKTAAALPKIAIAERLDHEPRSLTPVTYDLTASMSEAFLNRILEACISAGIVPVHFSGGPVGGTSAALRMNHQERFELDLIDPALFVETGNTKHVGIRSDFRGSATVDVHFEEWRLSGTPGGHVEPAEDFGFTIPFEGHFEATGRLEFRDEDNERLLVLSFAQLGHLDIIKIGDLPPGPRFTEVVRRVVERIAVTELRLAIRVPQVNGLIMSMPTPLRYIFDAQSAQIGSIDVKVVDVPRQNTGDELQMLVQAEQNVGWEDYDGSSSHTGTHDLAIVLSHRWLQQLRTDFWIGGVIPRFFDDSGMPRSNGPIHLKRFSFTLTRNGTLVARIRASRSFLGITVSANVRIEATLVAAVGVLHVRDVSVDVNPFVEWARPVGLSSLFFILYQLLASALLRGVNVFLKPWAEEQVQEFLESFTIQLRSDVKIRDTRITCSVEASEIKIDPSAITMAATSEISVG